MKVLVIGGAGYIGSILVRQLAAAKKQVRLLDTFLYGKQPISDMQKEINIVEADFRNMDITRYCMKGYDAVVHLAAIVGDQACDLDKNLTMDINCKSAIEVAALAKSSGVKKFIFSSTCSVYGTNENILSEWSPLNPVSLYAESKIAAEKEIFAMSDDTFKVCIPRFGTIYGVSPRMRFDLVVNVLAAKAVQEKTITIDGGDQWRPFLHVSDAANAICHLLMTKHDGVFNIGNDSENYQISQVGLLIQRETGTNIITCNENKDKRNYRVSFQRIALTDFVTQWTVAKGIKEIVQLVHDQKLDFKNAKYSNLAFLKAGAIEKLQSFKGKSR